MGLLICVIYYTVKLACMEFHTQHVPTADDILVATFCKIGGSKSLDTLEAFKYMWKEIYEQSLDSFSKFSSPSNASLAESDHRKGLCCDSSVNYAELGSPDRSR